MAAGEGACEIRRAVAADAGAIAGVLAAAFAEFRSQYTEEAFAATVQSPEGVAARMAEGPVWVAVFGGEIIGTVSAVVRDGEMYVRGMGVVPGARGHSAGWKMLCEAEREARAAGLRSLHLSTTPFLASAIALYERFGFARTALGPPDLFGTPLFTMTRAL